MHTIDITETSTRTDTHRRTTCRTRKQCHLIHTQEWKNSGSEKSHVYTILKRKTW